MSGASEQELKRMGVSSIGVGELVAMMSLAGIRGTGRNT